MNLCLICIKWKVRNSSRIKSSERLFFTRYNSVVRDMHFKFQ